MVREVATQS
jgi:hypothetical protein